MLPVDNMMMICCCNQYLSLPKAELNTKNSTKRQFSCRLVEFLVFNSIHWKKGDAFNVGDRVEYAVICGWPLNETSRWQKKLITMVLSSRWHRETRLALVL